jgi:hypothetical protein
MIQFFLDANIVIMPTLPLYEVMYTTSKIIVYYEQ